MKKFLSLLLCAMLALCALTPAMAETAEEVPAISIPVPVLFADYQARVAAAYTEISAESVLTWEAVEVEDGTAHVLYIDENYAGVLAIVDGEYLTDLMVVESGELSEDGQLITFFMMMSGIAASGVMPGDVVADNLNNALGEVMADFGAVANGEAETVSFFDRPCFYNVSTEDEVIYEFYFILDLNVAE